MRIPGIGPTLGSACRAEVERLRKQIDETRALIAQGEYKINVPGLGWHTRNSLQGLISRNREEIAGLRKSFNEMSFKIERPVIGIADRAALEQGIKSYQGELDKLAQNLSAGAGRASFPQLGWRTGAELRAAKDDIDRKVSEWGAALSKEEYRAPVPYVGNVTEKELKVQIAQLLARATPDREGAAKLQAAIPVVHAYGSLHRGWWMAEANRYAAALAEYGAYFDALRVFRMEQLSEREALRNEFDVDLRERVRQLEDEITYFERVIEQFIPQ
jgi:HAMP domain-containing protein